MSELIRKDLIYPELSYQLVGLLFEVHNEFGSQLLEKYYQKAIAEKMRGVNIIFKEQVQVKMELEGREIAKGYIDFVIDNKIILEIKRTDRFLKQNNDQVNSYLKLSGLKLAILANFTSRGVQFMRLVNLP